MCHSIRLFSAAVSLSVSAVASAVQPDFSPEWAFPDSNGTIFCSQAYNDRLYLGGNFTVIGGISASCVVEWDGAQFQPLGAGLSSSNASTLAARAMAVYDGKLIVAGNFTTAGGAPAGSIAAWDPVSRTWTTLEAGLGQTGGAPADVRALDVGGLNGGPGKLFAGGFFNLADGQPCLNVAAWNGTMWDNAGGGYNGTVNALEFFNGSLYAGGTGSSSNRFRYWNGVDPWTTVPNASISGGSTRVNDLQAHDGSLFIAGSFSSIGASTTSPNIAAFDGAVCAPVGPGLPGIAVNCMAVHDDGAGPSVAFGGTGLSPNNVTILDPVSGNPMTVANGLTNPVNTLASYLDTSGPDPVHSLYAGGTTFRFHFPFYTWTAPGGGIEGQFSSVTALAVGTGPGADPEIPPGDLYVAGVFTSLVHGAVNLVSNLEAIKIARLAAAREATMRSQRTLRRKLHHTKNALTTGLAGGDPIGLSFDDSDPFGWPALTVCGHHTAAGGQIAGGISFFNPITNVWSNPPVPGHTGSFEWFDPDTQFTGGAAEFSPPQTHRYLMGFSPVNQQFMPIPCGPNGAIRGARSRPGAPGTLLLWGFQTAVGCPEQPTGYLSTFDVVNETLSPWPGAPLNGPVNATSEAGPESALPGLYVGGSFTAAGATALNRAARWNGATWEALGGGLDGPVTAVCRWDDGRGEKVYFCGSFQNAGGDAANRIVCWDGAAWASVFGPTGVNGLNGPATSMAVVDLDDGHGPSLMVGGSFTTAGGLSSGRLAQLVARGAPVIARQPAPVVNAAPDEQARLSIRAYRSPPLSYRWRRNGNPLSDGGRISGATTPALVIDGVQESDAGRYTCEVTNDFGSRLSDESELNVGVPCPGDFNEDGDVDSQDFFDFLEAFFAGDADFNGDGETDSQDYFDFLEAFFAGCP